MIGRLVGSLGSTSIDEPERSPMADVITDLTDDDIRTEWLRPQAPAAETDPDTDADDDAADADDDAADADDEASDSDADQADS
jgi:hypothetical protein